MAPPLCRSLGRQCRALDLTLRVTALEGDEDHDATWLFGHTQHIDFGATFEEDGELWCLARVHVPCRHLKLEADGRSATCAAHGFQGKVPIPKRKPSPRRLGNDRFELVEGRRRVQRPLAPPPIAPAARRGTLPVLSNTSPCATAPCRTSDGTQKAACCRDLDIDIECTPRQHHLEALLRNRKSPYLCKVRRDPDDDSLLTVEMISACDYLQDDGISCDLHGRTRGDGRPAKPLMCSAWPEKRSGLHPGCAFRNRRIPL